MLKKFFHYLFHGGLITAEVVAMCAIVSLLSYSSMYFDPIKQTWANFQVTDTYFQMENANAENVADFNSDIVLYDISQCYSRAEIAAGIQRLYDYGAKVIALDVIFGGMGQDTIASDSLLRVIDRCDDRIVAACRMVSSYDSFYKEHSFFVPLTNCVEASVNVENETVRHFYKNLTFGDTCLNTFVYEIMRLGYPDEFRKWVDLEESNDKGEYLIHYKQLFFNRLHIYDDLFEDEVKDKIILMGDFQDLRDFHNIPVPLDGVRRICGTTIHGYSISTMTEDNRFINEWSDMTNLLIGLLVTLLFATLCAYVSEVYMDLSGFMITVAQLILMFVLIFLAAYIFINHQCNMGLLYVMLGTGLAGFCAEIHYFVLMKLNSTNKVADLRKNKENTEK